NSALPVTDSGLGWEQGLDAVEEWYRTREQPSRIQIYSADDSSTLAPECQGLAPLLSARGYTPSEAVLLLTGVTAEAADGASAPAKAAADGLRIEVADAPTSEHLAAWTSSRSPGQTLAAAEAFRGLITADQPGDFVAAYAPVSEHLAAWTIQRSPGQTPVAAEAFRGLITADQPCEFVSAYAQHPDGSRSMVAVCRVVERSKWGVITNLVTRPDLRRRGAGRSVARAAAALLAQRGVRSYLVDVDAGNEASVNLFASLGAT